MSIVVGTSSELGIESKHIRDFFETHWKRPIALSKPEFYQWQFIDIPYQNNIDHCCIAAEDKKILGIMGVNSRSFFVENKKLLGAELTTWVVDTTRRNLGIGTKMISYLQNKYEIIFGLGISSDALSIYLRHGFRYAKSIPRYLKVLHWDNIEPFAQYEPLAKEIAQHWNQRQSPSGYITEELNETKINDLFHKYKNNYNLFSREYEYIKWRYLEHPTFDYHIKIIKSNCENDGVLLVLRQDTSDEGLSILHIIDLIGDERDINAAMNYSIDFANDKGIPIIDFFCTSSKIGSRFLSSGWFSINDDPYFKFPHLFHPIELRDPASTSMIYWSNNYLAEFANLGKLYVTKQDADFDRPTLSNFKIKANKNDK
ncbi:MAG: GNAT family N-acetyltransferase [Proteobacteria bacterium]|nr:GNAT family N-acetyltransferase [Pseudomonadota bacterium]